MDHPVLRGVALLDREQRVATLDAVSVERDLDLAGLPLQALVGARVPHRHLSCPVLAAGDLALEVQVLDRVILGGGREAVVPRRLGQALRERPGGEHAVVLEPQIPVQAPGVVLLDHEPVGCRSGSVLPGGRLGCGGEVTFAAVGAQAAGARGPFSPRVPGRHA